MTLTLYDVAVASAEASMSICASAYIMKQNEVSGDVLRIMITLNDTLMKMANVGKLLYKKQLMELLMYSHTIALVVHLLRRLPTNVDK